MTMLERVKLALRLTTDNFDSDIEDNIGYARAELLRLGLSDEKVNDDEDKLIIRAIKTYCLMEYADTKDAERYRESWLSQIENLRKTKDYIDNEE